MYVIPDEGENVRQKKKSNSSDFTYHKKYSNTDMSAYNRVLNVLNKLDTSYNLNMPRMHEPVIEGKYKVTGDTRVFLIAMEHK